jgi:hypothetical protein
MCSYTKQRQWKPLHSCNISNMSTEHIFSGLTLELPSTHWYALVKVTEFESALTSIFMYTSIYLVLEHSSCAASSLSLFSGTNVRLHTFLIYSLKHTIQKGKNLSNKKLCEILINHLMRLVTVMYWINVLWTKYDVY